MNQQTMLFDEPLFIRTDNFNGLYAKRTYTESKQPSVIPRFVNRYKHHLFILSENNYYPLTDDTLQNIELISSKLGSNFTTEEIKPILHHFKYDFV